MSEFNFDIQQHDFFPTKENQTNFQYMEKIRVVVIEAHQFSLVGIRTALDQDEKIVVVGDAVNGTDGLHLLTKLQPDVAILDVALPGKDGIEITREIKRKNPEIKVIILTLCGSKETVLKAFAVGANSYCMKNIGYDKLIEAIHLTHRGHTWIDPTIAIFVVEQAQKNLPYLAKSSSQTLDNSVYQEMQELYSLTERELDVLQLIAQGNSNSAIANELYITLGTVKAHIRNIFIKVGAEDRTQAAVHALRYGLLD